MGSCPLINSTPPFLPPAIPIRIGVNTGSIEKDILAKYGGPCAEGLVESSLTHARMLEKVGFEDIVLSMKASDVRLTIDTYQLAASKCDYPLHVGVTEAGLPGQGTIKSAIGIGALLAQGIGNTIRVSLTGSPIPEGKAAWDILRALNLRTPGVQLVSCPTCGRTCIDVAGIAKRVEEELSDIKVPLKVAVMGCVVNGLGEAGDADIAVVGLTRDKVDIYVLGERRMTLSPDEVVEAVCGLIPAVEKQKEARNG